MSGLEYNVYILFSIFVVLEYLDADAILNPVLRVLKVELVKCGSKINLMGYRHYSP